MQSSKFLILFTISAFASDEILFLSFLLRTRIFLNSDRRSRGMLFFLFSLFFSGTNSLHTLVIALQTNSYIASVLFPSRFSRQLISLNLDLILSQGFHCEKKFRFDRSDFLTEISLLLSFAYMLASNTISL